jgi:allophanate hydrolase subunit 2
VIEIERTGSLNTVQDLGRFGFRHLGVSVSGVMDPLALRAGNALLGNDDNAAAIEVQMFPFRVRFHEAVTIALTGADCRARLDDTDLPPWWGCQVKKARYWRCVILVPVAGGISVWPVASMCPRC